MGRLNLPSGQLPTQLTCYMYLPLWVIIIAFLIDPYAQKNLVLHTLLAYD